MKVPAKKSNSSHLAELFRIIELTRSQVQIGYALRGVPKQELSDLAAHHYLVAFMAWQLARHANREGAELDIEKVFEFAMTHDLGEFFGGDIPLPYAAKNKQARTHAKAFEAENQKYLAKFFGPDKSYFKKLTGEIMDAYADEALVVKIADYVECTEYLQYVGKLDRALDFELTQRKLEKMAKRLQNKSAKDAMNQFITEWLSTVFEKDAAKILYL